MVHLCCLTMLWRGPCVSSENVFVWRCWIVRFVMKLLYLSLYWNVGSYLWSFLCHKCRPFVEKIKNLLILNEYAGSFSSLMNVPSIKLMIFCQTATAKTRHCTTLDVPVWPGTWLYNFWGPYNLTNDEIQRRLHIEQGVRYKIAWQWYSNAGYNSWTLSIILVLFETRFWRLYCPETGISSIDWAQQSRFYLYLRTETAFNPWNIVSKIRASDDVQKIAFKFWILLFL